MLETKKIDCTEEFLELRKITEMRDAYEFAEKELEKWEEEQYREEEGILRLVQELEGYTEVEEKEFAYLTDIRDCISQSQRERENQREEVREICKKKNLEWEEKEILLKKKIKTRQEGAIENGKKSISSRDSNTLYEHTSRDE